MVFTKGPIMPHQHSLIREQCALVIIDMQEAFRSSISDFAEKSAAIALATHAFRVLNIPFVVTEQYPKGLGRTANEIQSVLPVDFQPIEKTSFSACGVTSFEESLLELRALHIVVCGIEAHICVNQTVHDLLDHGYKVHFLTDCITARSEHDKQIAFSKMQQSGAIPSTTEMALFELLRDSRHEQFKSIQNLIK
jgi:nicotinamidase-related amidase